MFVEGVLNSGYMFFEEAEEIGVFEVYCGGVGVDMFFECFWVQDPGFLVKGYVCDLYARSLGVVFEDRAFVPRDVGGEKEGSFFGDAFTHESCFTKCSGAIIE